MITPIPQPAKAAYVTGEPLPPPPPAAPARKIVSSKPFSSVRRQAAIRRERRKKPKSRPADAPAGLYAPLWNLCDPDRNPRALNELIDSPHSYLDRIRQAADALNARALFYLGYCYLNGWGAREDHVVALACMELAVRRGFRRAGNARAWLKSTLGDQRIGEAMALADLCETLQHPGVMLRAA